MNIPGIDDSLLQQLAERARAQGCSVNDLLASLLEDHNLHQQNATLREREQQLQGLFEQATLGIIIANRDGEVVQSNRFLSAILGYEADELADFTFRNFTYPDDLEATDEAYRKLLSGELVSTTLEKRFVCKDRSVKWTRSTISLLHDSANQPTYFVIVLEDIDTLKRTEESLRSSESLLREILELAPVAIMITSLSDDEVLFANSYAATLITGGTPETVIGLNVNSIYVDQKARATLVRRLQQDGFVSEYEAWVANPDGSTGCRLISARVIDFQGQPALLKSFIDITERKRVEEALQHNGALFSGIISSAMDAVITIEEDESILIFNRAAEIMFGCTASEALGTKLSRFIPQEFRTAHSRHIRRFGETGATSRSMHSLNELTALRADGTVFPIEATISQIMVGEQKLYSVILRDITERRRTEQTLLEKEARYEGIIETAMDAIISIDEEQRVVVFNAAAERMFIMPAAEAIGQSLSRFIPQRYQAAHVKQVDQFVETKHRGLPAHSRSSLSAVRANGEVFPVEIALSQVTVGDQRFFSAIIRDVSERLRNEVLKIENEKVRIALQKERELVDLKGRFISTVSHEFRTPLAMIMSSSELLEHYADRLTEERRQECVRTVREQAAEMVTLMNDVLVFNKATAGKIELNAANVDLDGLLHSIIEQVQTTYDPEMHHLIVDNRGQVDTLWADEELLKRILINLLTNAIKYSPDGGEVRITVLRQNPYVLFHVSDQGIGIPPEDRARLFEPFHRAGNARNIGGTGLGLSIVKELVEAHHGQIKVESREGEGSTFTVMLPGSLN